MAGRAVGNRHPPHWSELQRDLLEMILEKLDLVAHARFAAVCSSWRSAATHSPPINKPLSFALSHDPENLIRRFITSFIPSSWETARFIGALDGWLVILIDDRDLFLLNKGSNSIIPLPPPPKDPKIFFENAEFCKAVLSSPPPPSSSSSSSSSSGECTVVLRRSNGGNLFYCRPLSDKSFSKLSNTSTFIVLDIQFYKGQLYVLCFPDTIVVFDHLPNKVSQFVTHLDNLCQMLVSENNLLIIGEWPIRLFKFERSESRVIPVNNINDNLLLLTRSYSTVFTTADISTKFRRNIGGIAVLESPYEMNNGDPWPLFFFMFSRFGIKNVVSKRTIT